MRVNESMDDSMVVEEALFGIETMTSIAMNATDVFILIGTKKLRCFCEGADISITFDLGEETARLSAACFIPLDECWHNCTASKSIGCEIVSSFQRNAGNISTKLCQYLSNRACMK